MSRDGNSSTTLKLGARARRALGGGRVRAALSLGIVLGLGSVGTLAAWSNSATATSGVFRTAAIEVKLGPTGSASKNFSFDALAKTGLLPGTITEAVLPVQNSGDVKFNYSVSAKAIGNAAVAEQITINTFGGTACTGTALGGGALSTTTSTLLMTAPRGPVNIGTGDSICVRATTGDALWRSMQNQSVTVQFTVTATSV